MPLLSRSIRETRSGRKPVHAGGAPTRAQSLNAQRTLQLFTRVAGQVQQRIDLGDGHALGTVTNFDDLVSRLNFSFPQHSKVEPRLPARGKQSGHLGLVHPDTDAVASNSRLRHLEQGLSDPVSVADAYLVVGHPVDREVLAKLPVSEIASTQPLLPIPVRLDLIDKDRPLLPSVTREIRLSVAVDVEPPHHPPALDRILPDRGTNGPPPPGEVARKADVDRQKSRHQPSPYFSS